MTSTRPSAPTAPLGRRRSRRAFLQTLGAAGALAPFFPLLNASGAEARPLRLILWFTPHGTLYDQWKPTGSPNDYALGPILKPLERHRSKIVVLDGLKIQADGVGAPHTKGPALLFTASPLQNDMTFTRSDGSGGMYYGWNSAPSVDQVILSRIGAPTAYPSLEFGVRSGGNHPGSRIIYSGAAAPRSPETSPWRAFDRLIGDIGRSTEELAAARAERRSVLDLVGAELAEIETRAPAADRAKIGAHLQAVRDIERRLTMGAASCEGPNLGAAVDANSAGNTPVVFDRMIEILTSSLACDLTRFASLQYRVGENDGGYTYDWLGVTSQEHHLLSHEGDTNAGARADLAKIYTWYTERFASFLDQLAAIPEGDGTLLDNCLVVWGSELGKGNTHSFDRVPFILAGGAAGQLTTGRWLEFNGTPHNRLLVSICRLLGLSDTETFGTTDTGRGPLVGLV